QPGNSSVIDSTARSVTGRSLPANQRWSGSHSRSSPVSDSMGSAGALRGRRNAVFVMVTPPLAGTRSQSSAVAGRDSGEPEPVEAVAPEGQQIRQLADGREPHPAEQFDGVAAVEL